MVKEHSSVGRREFRRVGVGIVLLMLTSMANAQEFMAIEGTLIRGEQESPTVMYLVPWQPPLVQNLERAEGSFMVERGIVPLERYQFQRVLSYHERFAALNPAPGSEGEQK